MTSAIFLANKCLEATRLLSDRKCYSHARLFRPLSIVEDCLLQCSHRHPESLLRRQDPNHVFMPLDLLQPCFRELLRDHHNGRPATRDFTYGGCIRKSCNRTANGSFAIEYSRRRSTWRCTLKPSIARWATGSLWGHLVLFREHEVDGRSVSWTRCCGIGVEQGLRDLW